MTAFAISEAELLMRTPVSSSTNLHVHPSIRRYRGHTGCHRLQQHLGRIVVPTLERHEDTGMGEDRSQIFNEPRCDQPPSIARVPHPAEQIP